MSWKPDYPSGRRDTVGTGGPLPGYCGLYNEVPLPKDFIAPEPIPKPPAPEEEPE